MASVILQVIQQVLSTLPQERAAHFDEAAQALLATQAEQYWKLLQKWNATIRLTGAQSDQDFAYRHLADSLYGLCLIGDLPPQSHCLDVGAGAGLPSYPLAMALPQTQWDLAESHRRRCSFLQQVRRSFSWMSRVQVKTVRVSGDPTKETLRDDYDLIVFRAVAPEQFLPIAHHYIQPQGRILYWGTPTSLPELPDTLQLIDTFPYQLEQGESFILYAFTHA